MASSSFSSFSEDILIQILVYLPVISLLRFKSVCKSWLALIENSDFIYLHATTLRPDNSSKFATFIFQALIKSFSGRKKNSNIFTLSGDYDNETFEDLSMPTYTDGGDDIRLLLGTCNGIVCLHHETNNNVTLWNPATKQFRLVPKPLTVEAGIGRQHNDFVAFGFDVKTKDYKVIRIGTYFQEPFDCTGRNQKTVIRVQVYSLSTDSWRFIEDVTSLTARPYEQTFMSHGMYLNGSYFVLGLEGFDGGFIGGLYHRKVILSFDFTEETFTTMRLPIESDNPLTLVNLDGRIALMDLAEKFDYHFNTYNVWVFNKSCVEESWTRLYSIGPIYRGVDVPRGMFRIVKKGEYAIVSLSFSCGWMFQLFNIVTEEMKNLRTNYGEVIRADVYKESLVPISRNGA